MSALDITVVNDGTLGMLLRSIGQVADGWVPWKNGFAFFGRGAIDYRGDRKISVDVDIKARPNSRASTVKEFPPDLEASDTSRFSLFGIKHGKLTILFPIEHVLDRAHLAETESLLLKDYGTEIRSPRSSTIWFELGMRFRIAAPQGKSAPVVREYDTQFWQGGLPSLGRRR